MTGTIARIAKTLTFAAAATCVALGLATQADAASGTMYGDPAAAAQWWRHQKYDDCVLMSSADIVGQVTGREPSEQSIIKKAQNTPSAIHPGSIYIKPADTKNPNSGQGTMFADVPTLLKLYNVDAVISDKDHAAKTGVPAGLEGIEQLLGSGHAVMVSVNGEMIWGQPIDPNSQDENGNPVSDHAVVVTGIDTANNVVHLNDSGDPKGRDEQIPLGLFVKAWDTSNELVVVTTDKVRY
ncbi:C39 family peptidase [Mycobacterium sp. Marseille-P9652]|uniref:C39 family peptidase n=1 Tax=Mycobacterium sp. Marseille-P9652 TaxID=2654950 RepID=UPI0012E789BE|nr:C39 family peptidase [Mycobacterium sp. Marseille-P9652]